MTGKTALVTGASSGIGEATARKLQAMGFTVYAAARRLERMQVLAADGIAVMGMDVTDDASMRAGIERIIAESGRIDVLANNAGYGSHDALEDVEIDERRRQFEVTVFGAIRLAQLVPPPMRASGAGTIVNISSTGGNTHTPPGGWYHGTKSALEALSDCLRLEVRPFGIDVVVIEPGGIAAARGNRRWAQLPSAGGGRRGRKGRACIQAQDPVRRGLRCQAAVPGAQLPWRPAVRCADHLGHGHAPALIPGFRRAATLPPAGNDKRAGCLPDPPSPV
ncbi:SDR family NAD(P)-dependent oxidoreductase [Arthrobacter sp. AQ5-05]|uniref:SDR family NAD(P)-dependent oxidoreductase n=1 Tax=Arthrobacter sp. AQ5-05 TaxID=2184581 RepID=UPI002570094B|nr:SDR family NAD(P)-dependent oxidoreductase [Arthrobacter sp. AQ5-05]